MCDGLKETSIPQNSFASRLRQLTVEEPIAVVPERTLLGVGTIGERGKCMLPISRAGLICERNPHTEAVVQIAEIVEDTDFDRIAY